MLAVVFGSLGALIGLALLLAGLALVLAQAFARDDDGYYTSDTKRLATPTYALTVEDIDLGSDPVDVVDSRGLSQLIDGGFLLLDDARLQATDAGRQRLDAVLARLLP